MIGLTNKHASRRTRLRNALKLCNERSLAHTNRNLQ